MTNFNKFLFEGLNARSHSNKYTELNRVSEDGNKIVVKVAASNLIKTKFGYALILDHTRVAFLKEWQVQSNWYGTEVVLTREYFKVSTWGEHTEFTAEDKYCSFDAWLEVAKEQQEALDEDGCKANPALWIA